MQSNYSIMRHSIGLEKVSNYYRRLLDYRVTISIHYNIMETLPHKVVGLETMLDYRGSAVLH